MNKFINAAPLLFLFFLFSCAAGKKNYSPAKKYDQKTLQEEYMLLKNILEKKHPSLYWYTSKDSMDFYFQKYYQQIGDSMTEQQYAWKILAPLVDKINCGHTSVSLSKAYAKWADGRRFPAFPLTLKVWNDSMAVIGNMNRKDSIFKRGTLVKSVNGLSTRELVNNIFGYLPQDGFANNINYIRMSANFPYYHRNIYGLSKEYQVTYLDKEGNEKTATIPVYTPPKDSARKKDSLLPKPIKLPKPTREERLQAYRSLKIDSSGKYAILNLNTFSKGHLRRFFRRSFRELKEKNIQNLVLDLRNNGGGRVGVSTLLTKYISRHPFKVADTLFSVTKNLGPYTRYIKGKFLNNIELIFICRKKADGLYHIGHLERKLYQPKKKLHYNGNVYVLVNGPTFSASTLFSNAIKGQPGITIAGEETGGGWYGNNGIMIPDIILPHTGVRVRLPLFRLVQYKHKPELKGSGIIPDLYIGTSYDAILKGYDYKMKLIRERILNGNP